jgi:hypothetical protein
MLVLVHLLAIAATNRDQYARTFPKKRLENERLSTHLTSLLEFRKRNLATKLLSAKVQKRCLCWCIVSPFWLLFENPCLRHFLWGSLEENSSASFSDG